jgi:hypothetical protein
MAQRFADLVDVVPPGEQDRSCLEEIRSVLAQHGCLDRFGLTLLHDHFALDAAELLVESTDSEARRLTIEPQLAADTADGGRLVETSWHFTEQGDGLQGWMLLRLEGQPPSYA